MASITHRDLQRKFNFNIVSRPQTPCHELKPDVLIDFEMGNLDRLACVAEQLPNGELKYFWQSSSRVTLHTAITQSAQNKFPVALYLIGGEFDRRKTIGINFEKSSSFGTPDVDQKRKIVDYMQKIFKTKISYSV